MPTFLPIRGTVLHASQQRLSYSITSSARASSVSGPCSGASVRSGAEDEACAGIGAQEFVRYFGLRVPEIVTRGRFPDGGESDSTWRTQEARHVGSDTIAPGF